MQHNAFLEDSNTFRAIQLLHETKRSRQRARIINFDLFWINSAVICADLRSLRLS